MSDTIEWIRWTEDFRWHRVAQEVEPRGGKLRTVATACYDIACEEEAGFIALAPGMVPPTIFEGDEYSLCPECVAA